MFIYPYRNGSRTVASLKEKLGAKIIKLQNSKFLGENNKQVLNWGCSISNKEIEKCSLLNKPSQIAMASNKKIFFDTVKDVVSIPEFTNDLNEAYSWLENNKTIVVREKLTGNSGEGIVLIESEEDWDNYDHNNSKLYVKYIPKKEEYRVHVFCGEIILIQKKGIERGYKPENWKVRNHANGFIFIRNDVNPPDCVVEQAKLSIEQVGLDFGAVDVIYNEYRKQAYVLEINTAPGLENSTFDTYIEAISKHFNLENVSISNIKEETPDINPVIKHFARIAEVNLCLAGRPILQTRRDNPFVGIDDRAQGYDEF